MANRRPIVNVSGALTEVPVTDSLTSGMEVNLSRTVLTGAVATFTATTRYTFFNGTSGGSLVITLPAAAASIDGQIFTFSSTNNRASLSWSSSGATVTGLPNSLVSGNPVTVQYIHSQTRWFVS